LELVQTFLEYLKISNRDGSDHEKGESSSIMMVKWMEAQQEGYGRKMLVMVGLFGILVNDGLKTVLEILELMMPFMLKCYT
jgi:hypothetical protein